MAEILASVIRGETVESIHRGHLIVVDGNGSTIARIGDPGTTTFWRSAAKSFQAIPFITSGAADAYGFTKKEIALTCASHSGESFHTALCRQMLEKAGFDEENLRCGTHPSFHNETARRMIRNGEKPTQLNNNCSGKHAAMLAFARHIEADSESYLSLESPVQKAILETVSDFTGVAACDIKLGIDGCSAPNFAVPVSAMAKAFAKLIKASQTVTGDIRVETRSANPREEEPSLETACARIVSAQLKYPEYVGGSVRLDTKIMQALRGQLICKVGAEGVWCAGVLPSERWENGLGISLKIEDGDDGRARPVVAVELLRQLGLMTVEAEKSLGEFSPMMLTNRMETEVGRVTAVFKI